MQLMRRSTAWGFLIAVVGAIAVTVTRVLFDGHFGTVAATIVFLLAVVAAGIAGGWKAGFLSTGLSVLGVLVFARPGYTPRIPNMADVVRLLAYLAGGVAISVLCEGLRRAWQRIEERQRQLVLEIGERSRAEEQLREADRRKDEFLAMLAHELRNPLAPLSNALQLWSIAEKEGTQDPAEMNSLRAMMRRQVDQMTRLIDDLLDVSRINRGTIQLRIARVDVGAVLSEAIDAQKSLAEVSGQDLKRDIPADPLLVEGDATRLVQIFGNVLHNAIKFTPPGGRIAVAAQLAGAEVIIRIRDTGCGIPAPMLTQIFEMFEQVDQSLGRAHGGLGIGLTLVKRLVELHRGTIVARSEGLGKGSEFVIRFPALRPEPDAAESKPGEAPPPKKQAALHRILVVDDVKASAETLTMLLRVLGHDVVMANDGKTALELAAQSRPDTIFLDIAMPEMNGYEVARRIRATPALKEVVIVALTGYGQEEDRRRAKEAGFDYHVTKPASVAGLREILARRGTPLSRERLALQTTGEPDSTR
jgi:signal transduction histidine kinase/ActR/RegA family two-component response regulator